MRNLTIRNFALTSYSALLIAATIPPTFAQDSAGDEGAGSPPTAQVLVGSIPIDAAASAEPMPSGSSTQDGSDEQPSAGEDSSSGTP
jgi:hypothetical protein